MGKKLGINPKALEARERKESQKRAKNEQLQMKKEEDFWKDDDKHVNRKLNRQKDREVKSQAERDRKLANKAAYERDMELAESSSKKTTASSTRNHQKPTEIVNKVSRHEIQQKLDAETSKLSKQLKNVNLDPIHLAPNINHLDDGENARSIDQALELLSPWITQMNDTVPLANLIYIFLLLTNIHKKFSLYKFMCI